jgi:hypothetical protein
MSDHLYEWSILCQTEGKSYHVWKEGEGLPLCPTNPLDTVDSAASTILRIVRSNLVEIKEEQQQTGGHYQVQTVGGDMAVGVNTVDTSWPFPTSALAIRFISVSDHKGDNLEVQVAPDTTVGAITSDVSIGDSVLNVDATALNTFKLGYWLTLTDGVNSYDMGRVVGIDTGASTITTENTSTFNFLVATPTLVRCTTKTIVNYEIGEAGQVVLGESKIGGSYVPANVIVRMIYTNNGASTKRFCAQVEYLY